MKRYLTIFIIILILFSISIIALNNIKNQSNPDTNIQPINTNTKTITGFTDVTKEAGLDYIQQKDIHAINETYLESNLPQIFSGGAAAADYNNDGFIDLYVTILDGYDILYKNNGDGTFSDTTEQVGLKTLIKSNGAGWADIDNDGDKDLFVTTIEEDRFYLFINEDGKFKEEAIERGTAIKDELKHNGFSVSFGDYNNDGFIDIHTTEWDKFSKKNSNNDKYGRLLKNRGEKMPGFFDDVTDEANIRINGFQNFGDVSFTSSFVDFDNDGWQDLAIIADFGNSKLFWNNKDGTFTDGTDDAEVGKEDFGMGNAIGDIDNDGDLDWFVSSIYCDKEDCLTNMKGHRLYLYDKNRIFYDATDELSLNGEGWGWGTSFLDFDNDGDLDLALTNGVQFQIMGDHDFSKDEMQLWENKDNKMIEISKSLNLTSENGRGLLTLDYDNDGDLDIFIVRNSNSPILYRNDLIGNNWLKIKLIGKESNKDGFGTKVIVRTNNKEITRTLIGGNNFLSQNSPIIHIGLKDETIIKEIEIIWPLGNKQILKNIKANQLLTVKEK